MMEARAAKCQTSGKTFEVLLAVPMLALLLLLGASGAEAQPAEKIDGIDGAPSAGDPYYPRLGNSGYDVKHYDVELSLDPARRFAQGRSIAFGDGLRMQSHAFERRTHCLRKADRDLIVKGRGTKGCPRRPRDHVGVRSTV